MSEPFLAEIRMIGFIFAPRGWAFCDGQILPINQNQSLYSLLGTTYGGDGRTSFGLPDLRGRIPFHVGNGKTLGQKAGQETHTLTQQEMPVHRHALHGYAGRGDAADPVNHLLAESSTGDLQYASDSLNEKMSSAAIGNTGNGQPHNNLPPYLVVNFVIALQGVFPPLN